MYSKTDYGIVGYVFIENKEEKAICIECVINKKLKFPHNAAVHESDADATKLICECCENLLIY